MKNRRKRVLEAAVFVVILIAIAVFFVYGIKAVDRHDEANQKPISSTCLDNMRQIEGATYDLFSSNR